MARARTLPSRPRRHRRRAEPMGLDRCEHDNSQVRMVFRIRPDLVFVYCPECQGREWRSPERRADGANGDRRPA